MSFPSGRSVSLAHGFSCGGRRRRCGWDGSAGLCSEFTPAFTAQVPAPCQELDGYHLELSLHRHDRALTVRGSRAHDSATLGPAGYCDAFPASLTAINPHDNGLRKGQLFAFPFPRCSEAKEFVWRVWVVPHSLLGLLGSSLSFSEAPGSGKVSLVTGRDSGGRAARVELEGPVETMDLRWGSPCIHSGNRLERGRR